MKIFPSISSLIIRCLWKSLGDLNVSERGKRREEGNSVIGFEKDGKWKGEEEERERGTICLRKSKKRKREKEKEKNFDDCALQNL